jgi:hypothetical protein
LKCSDNLNTTNKFFNDPSLEPHLKLDLHAN